MAENERNNNNELNGSTDNAKEAVDEIFDGGNKPAEDNDENAEKVTKNQYIPDNNANTGEYVSQFDELAGAASYSPTEIPKKKSIKVPIIITVIVVLVLAAAVVGGYFVFFNNDIQGVWKNETIYDSTTYATVASEASDGSTIKSIVYYTFTNDNELIINTGDNYAQRTTKYDYELTEDNTINILVDSQVVTTFTYTIEGNLITGKTLSLTVSGDTTAMEFTSVSSADMGTIEKMNGFTPDEKLTGEWTNNNVMFSYVFGDDGMIKSISKQAGYSEIKCAYTFDGKTVTARTAEGDDGLVTFEIEFINDNKITIDGTEFVREGSDETISASSLVLEDATEDTTYEGSEDGTEASEADTEAASSDSEESTEASDEAEASAADTEASEASDAQSASDNSSAVAAESQAVSAQ